MLKIKIAKLDGCIIKELNVKLGMTVTAGSSAVTMSDQQSGLKAVHNITSSLVID